jgi:hypothetical protein
MTSEIPGQSDDLAKSEWRRIAEFYVWLALATGVPSGLLSLYLWTPTIAVAWLQCIMALPVIMGAVILLWGLTAYPFLLLLGLLFGRGNNSAGSRDLDGPGVVICPFGTVAASRGRQPSKPVQPTRAAEPIGKQEPSRCGPRG